ncbi:MULTISPECIES: MarR family winged helix-turn-helix transcriptional regulator [Streptomyces]|uniref:MarR family transcriptional regulator n=1 Tax=Streptomyces griseoaurantiacus TaxID=68213 RepID=A0ABZ1V0V9_9ACTN|nr:MULTISPECIES: MarR family transcriptional regulator [Streptomyces]MCF0090179.1 hypothetical protein [Streptomyces sp. MH192]MCF0102588.1 hypothetical protein [Streptomyces sp. MH191]MDX3363023.1 MarR family transcriptional regulator [Streptomyces sp. ME02-6978.2a]GHE36480.1 hypothetical protein GCM10018782_08580 [Streptomyces griseoaurantiacus]
MDETQRAQLFELADLIMAIGRHLQVAKADEGESWTPLESAVMRYIDHRPGSTATQAAEATRLISSNFSRALRKLEQKGMVRREADPQDARRVRLHPTRKAGENLRHLEDTWSRLLAEAVPDTEETATVVSTLRQIESHLIARTGRG